MDSKKDEDREQQAEETLQVEHTEAEDEERDEGKVKFKSTMQREEIASYFDAIVVGLRKGKLQFRQGDEVVSLSPSSPRIKIEVKAEKKGDKEKFSLELSWRPGSEKMEVE